METVGEDELVYLFVVCLCVRRASVRPRRKAPCCAAELEQRWQRRALRPEEWERHPSQGQLLCLMLEDFRPGLSILLSIPKKKKISMIFTVIPGMLYMNFHAIISQMCICLFRMYMQIINMLHIIFILWSIVRKAIMYPTGLSKWESNREKVQNLHNTCSYSKDECSSFVRDIIRCFLLFLYLKRINKLLKTAVSKRSSFSSIPFSVRRVKVMDQKRRRME